MPLGLPSPRHSITKDAASPRLPGPEDSSVHSSDGDGLWTRNADLKRRHSILQEQKIVSWQLFLKSSKYIGQMHEPASHVLRGVERAGDGLLGGVA
jgi:hypothetical protein